MQGLLSEDNASPSYGPLLSEPSVYMTDWVINAALLHRFMYERTVFSCSASYKLECVYLLLQF